MKKGDLVTGIDKSYKRSIYRIVSVEPFVLQFDSYDGTIATKNGGYFLKNSIVKIEDYRLASKKEIIESRGDFYYLKLIILIILRSDLAEKIRSSYANG